MSCYGALQESATYLAYRAQKDRAEVEKDATLEAIFFLVSRDEAAHAGFYRSMIEIEMDEDRVGTLADLAYVIAHFKMPGDGLLPNYHENLRSWRRRDQSARVPDAGGVSIAQAVGHQPRRTQERQRRSSSTARGVLAILIYSFRR